MLIETSQTDFGSASWISLRYTCKAFLLHVKHKGIFSQDLETNIFDKYVPFYHDAVFNVTVQDMSGAFSICAFIKWHFFEVCFETATNRRSAKM